MRIILVRHGDAHAGLHGIIAGPRGCQGLTGLGRDQADRLRRHIETTGEPRADVLIASTLPRAIETAQIVAPALGFDDIAQDCDLCEVHVGTADGTDWADHIAAFGSLDMVAEPDRRFAEGGDSWNSFNDRVEAAMHRLAREHPEQTVMAFCHAGVIAASLRVLLGYRATGDAARLLPTNTGLTEWEYSAEQWTLHSYNRAPHLV